ncbi:MAG: hypothetical protein WBO77_02330 [Microgenomates group bacterium]
MNKTKRVISISNWYYFFRVIISVSVLYFAYMFFSAVVYELRYVLTGLLGIILFVQYTLYWLKSGIYITSEGDHIVKWAGWVAKEDKLLNGVVISNQVVRGPLDQLLGMATLTTGIFAARKLIDVRYADIGKYDELMRQGSTQTFVSPF